MRGVFGGCDVSDQLNKLKGPFEVNIKLFGDPRRGTHKFLKITKDGESVLVGEGDVVWKLADVVSLPPACNTLSPLTKYVRGKKGLCLQSITSNAIPAIIQKEAESVVTIQELVELDDVKVDSCDFVFCSDFLLCVPNPIALLCALYAALCEGGYCIVSLPIATHPSTSDKTTNMQFEAFLSIFDAKTSNDRITATHAASNVFCDFNLLRAMLRFALLIPQYVQNYKERQVIVAKKITITPSPQSTNTKFTFPEDVMFCPHCGEMMCKDDRCSFVYCGLGGDDVFRVGFGCGKAFCYTCGKKYCGQHYDAQNGQKLPAFRENHDARCCASEPGFQQAEYCCGGHSKYCNVRW